MIQDLAEGLEKMAREDAHMARDPASAGMVEENQPVRETGPERPHWGLELRDRTFVARLLLRKWNGTGRTRSCRCSSRSSGADSPKVVRNE